MSKINLSDLSSLTQQPTSAVSTINSNNTEIETRSDSFLSRNGTSPNEMLADLDMNSHRLLNLPDPTTDAEPVTLGYFTENAPSVAQPFSSLTLTGTFNFNESTNRSYTLKTRTDITNYPVPYLRPTATDKTLAFDLMPNGSPSEQGTNGYVWSDWCDTDISTTGTNVTAARVGVKSTAVEFGSRTFGTGTVKPIYFTINDGTPKLVIDTSGNILMGGATAQSANAFQVELNHSTNSGQVIGSLNSNSGTSAYCAFGSKAQTANGFIISYSDNYVGALYGITLAGYTTLLSNAGNGLLIGTGASNKPIVFGTLTGSECMRIDGSKNVIINSAAIATNATDGFLYIPTCAGTPTGTPTTYTGRCAQVYDTTNNKLYVYNGGWKSTTLS